MKLKPFKELVAMSKEKLDEAMAPIRAKQVRSKAELEMAELEAEILTTETRIHEMCIEKEINFKKLIEASDKHALLVRRQKQYEDILDQLFPKGK